MIPIVEEQMKELREKWPGASYERLGNGTAVVVVPGVPLPNGNWSRKDTTVRFVAPVGYPHARPDCFWADGDLRLASGATPQASNTGNLIPGLANCPPVLWFSWHVAQWDPNRNTLVTYLNAIRDRFKKAQ